MNTKDFEELVDDLESHSAEAAHQHAVHGGYFTAHVKARDLARDSILAEFRKRNELILRLRNKLDDCAKWMSEAEPYLGGEFLVRQLAERVIKEVDEMKLEVSDEQTKVL